MTVLTEGGGGAGPWGEWSRHVLSALENHQTGLDSIRAEITAMRVSLAEVNLRAETLKQDLAEARTQIASLASARDLAELKEKMGALADARALVEAEARIEKAEAKQAASDALLQEARSEIREIKVKAAMISGAIGLLLALLGVAAKYIWH
jgi:chromosome segregation ATPase